jgi:hypothetical protein
MIDPGRPLLEVLKMKALGYLTLAVLTVSLVACGNKGGDNGNQQPPPYNPNALNPYGIVPGAGQSNPNSIDLVGGKIVSRNFHAFQGTADEKIESDSCKESLNEKDYPNINFGRGFNNNDLELNFDASGVLTITLHLVSGDLKSGAIMPNVNQASSDGVFYFLEKGSHSLSVSPFVVQGTPKQQWANSLLANRGISKKRMGGNNNYYASNISSDLGWVPDSPKQVLPTVNSNNILNAAFKDGLQLHVLTPALGNTRHIIVMEADNVAFKNESIVSDPQGNGTCLTSSNLNIVGFKAQ